MPKGRTTQKQLTESDFELAWALRGFGRDESFKGYVRDVLVRGVAASSLPVDSFDLKRISRIVKETYRELFGRVPESSWWLSTWR